MNEWYEKAVRDALGSTLGWWATIFVTTVAGFCAGYWIGHREFTDASTTFHAFLFIPFLWLGFRPIVIAYVVVVAAFYFPLRIESVRLRVAAASVNLVTWLLIIWWIVEESKDGKFFRY